MASDTIVIVGGGQAAFQVAASLREEGCTAPVVVVTRERELPYQRSWLTQGYLTGALAPAEMVCQAASFYQRHHVEVALGDSAELIDRNAQTVVLASGRRLRYRALVLATGARPRKLRVPGADLRGARTLRTLADAVALRRSWEESGRLVVIGAGLLGMELASVARDRDQEVTVIEAGRRAMARTVTPETAARLTAAHRRRGTRLLPLREVTALLGDRDGRVSAVRLNDGRRLPAETVIAAIGVLPRTGLAARAGLHTGDGVLVDQYLRTSDRAIYALGDCARFASPLAGRHIRLESAHNAIDQARCLARTLCGRPEPYAAVPWFSSSQCGSSVHSAGLVGQHDGAVVNGDPATGRFTVYCFQGDRLIGVESVNRPAEHLMARGLLAAGGPGPRPDEVARADFALTERVERCV